MKHIVMIGSFAASLMLVACGGELNEAAEAMKNVQSIAASADDAAKTMDKMEARRQERVAKGDTLAMDPEALKGYLPVSISSYEAKEPSYETVNTPGMSMTVVKKEFTKPDGSRVNVSITDYNASAMGYMGAAAMFAVQMKVDNDQSMSATFNTDNEFVNGYEEFDKVNKDATVTYGVGGRFLVSIRATKQESTNFVKSVASSMKLDKLAAM